MTALDLDEQPHNRCPDDKPCNHCKAGRPEAPANSRPADLSGGVWELDEDVRVALPPAFHRPEWLDTCTPKGWVCACCWGDGWMTSWPCGVASAHGGYLAGSWRDEAKEPMPL